MNIDRFAYGVLRNIPRNGTSAVERVECCLDRIRRFNPSINAVVTVDEQGALAAARLADIAWSAGKRPRWWRG